MLLSESRILATHKSSQKRSNERKFKANKNGFKKYIRNKFYVQSNDRMCTYKHADAFTEK